MPNESINVEGKSVEDYKEAVKSGEPVEATKLFTIEEMKASKDKDGNVVIDGYANTKGNRDRYGDIPTVFPQLRNYVYELKEYNKNPIVLIDHYNSVGYIAGSCSPKMGGHCYEDDKGLKFRMVFTKSNYPLVAHARTVFEEGHGKALSIGGKWFHEDKDNEEHLTYAEINEFSLVGVGADPNALTAKSIDETEKVQAKNLSDRIAEMKESIKAERVTVEDADELRLVLKSIDKEGLIRIEDDRPSIDDVVETICKNIIN